MERAEKNFDSLYRSLDTPFVDSADRDMNMLHSKEGVVLVFIFLLACSSVPETPGVRYRAGLRAKEQGNLEEAHEYFEDTVQLKPGHRKAQLELVSLHLKRNEPDYAISHLNTLIDHLEQDEDRTPSARIFARRGEIYYQAGNYKNAIRDATRALESDEASAEALYTRGLAYLERDDVQNALTDFRKSLEIRPNAVGHLGLARIRLRYGDWDTAVEHLNQAINQNSDFAEAYKYRAVAHRETGHTERMKDDLYSYLKLKNPNVSEQAIREQLEEVVQEHLDKAGA